MLTTASVAWKQLSHHRVKLAVAAAGVVVAVMLMLVQLGIREGAMENSIAFPQRIRADLIVVSPRTKTIFQSAAFPRRLLFRLPAHPAVEDVREIYMAQGRFRNPWEHREYPISVYGIDPDCNLIDLPGLTARATELQLPDFVLFDALSRRNFGPIAKTVQEQGWMETEINFRKVRIIDTIKVGISITTDGNMYASPANFLRLFPQRTAGTIDLGLVRLKPGVETLAVRKELSEFLGPEARVLTHRELMDAEVKFLRENHPIDFIFGMGAAVGFFIGFVVVYQILYTEVTNHLPEFATLKAMGYTDGYLTHLVLYQSFFLSMLGYFPGFLMALGIYQIATVAIQMPFGMTTQRAVMVFALTLTMCGLSGVIAIQKAKTANPADIF